VKLLKRSVSVVIERGERVLLVRRPDDDESLPGLWGLPAATLHPGESEEDAVRRAGRIKLGVQVRPLSAIGEAEEERPGYRVHMRDWRAEIEAGEPAVPQPGDGTQYDALRWGDPTELIPAAGAGSLCCRILLRSRGLTWSR
jgi:ADP-ribose pyrophosphatase YjhB (NUDIX family)